ncbi:T9SS type A sorting domain-containing protein [Corallibacter sp.]|uniref:T9SS type A sorting domain-containing protein n=1 Tax=Corallibacter sp. TaxID=2038084 RepID=UPI003AB218E1
MKRLIHITFLLTAYLSFAQGDISEIEYYFDTDPGIGNGTSIDIDPDVEVLNQNFSIPTTGLSAGNHKLFVRAVKDDGSTSYYYSQSFSVKAANATFNTANIDGFEYYVDTDPGIGNGTQLSVAAMETIDQSFNIPIAALSSGSHKLFIRAKNSDGTYGAYDNVAFSINQSPAVFNNYDITAAEYYFGTDPGTGNATAITIPTGETLDENLAFLTNTLPQGSHRAFVRVKNANDVWSLYDHIVFSVVPLAEINIADINSIEYYFDADPGIGLGNQVTITDTETVDQNLAIPTTGLPTGSHRLFIRVGNTAGNYSVYTHTVFSVRTPTFFNNASIVAAEYFIDIDPGEGNGNPITTSGDSIDENVVIATSGSMAQGDHYVYVRVQNADGTWSLYDKQYFEVSGTLGIASNILTETKIYPIPSSDFINIATPNNAEIKSAQLVDIQGKVVLSINQNINRINITSLQQGVYLLQIITNAGSLSKRVIKN